MPIKSPFSASLSSQSKSHFLLLSSIKTGLGSQSPYRHKGRARISSLPDPIPGVHLSDYITFMTQFRIIVNGLQPPEIIKLHTDTEQRIGELLTKVLPDHHFLDILRVRAFARSEPRTCPVTTWSRRLPKEKEPSLKLCGLCMPNPAYTVWHKRLGNDMVRKT
ncbi:hypothetical protein TNCV_4387791 [Trichonephila clavipes]|nr:hypothetical protein TNCV_4387791 [Trichonephila clavipes]